jgi:hypothetical protein
MAISDARLIRRHHNGLAVAASNRSAILAFQVDDVEALLLQVSNAGVMMPVTKMPWGNTSALLQDPDGNLVIIFSAPDESSNQTNGCPLNPRGKRCNPGRSVRRCVHALRQSLAVWGLALRAVRRAALRWVRRASL